MNTTEHITDSCPANTNALVRHFADLRDGTHGGASSRTDKQHLFAEAVTLLDRYARQALDEINTDLLLDTGELSATGVRRSAIRGLDAVWTLAWPQQQAARIDPITIRAYFGGGSPHPHLQGGTVGELAPKRVGREPGGRRTGHAPRDRGRRDPQPGLPNRRRLPNHPRPSEQTIDVNPDSGTSQPHNRVAGGEERND